MGRRREEEFSSPGDDAPRKPKNPGVAVAIVGSVAISALSIGGLLVYSLMERSKQQNAEVVEAELAKLLDDWRSNPVAVTERYRSKRVRVKGFVRSFDATSRGMRIEIAAEKSGLFDGKLHVLFGRRLQPLLKDYPVGSQIIVDVICDNPDTPPRVEAVAVVPPSPGGG